MGLYRAKKKKNEKERERERETMIPVVIFSFLLRNSAESLHKGCRYTCTGERGVGLPVEKKRRPALN